MIIPLLVSVIFTQSFCYSHKLSKIYEKDLPSKVNYSLYNSDSFPLCAHVVRMPLHHTEVKLIPALGQREEVSSIAKRSQANIAINGSNYRRGGRYNGNRVNLMYLKPNIYSDLQYLRGACGWDSDTKTFLIDAISLKINFSLGTYPFPIDAINQPRKKGTAALFTHVADIHLLSYNPGLNIMVNKNMVIEDITDQTPTVIPEGWLIYQKDSADQENIQRNMPVTFDYSLQSAENVERYNDYDFILAGAGLLIHHNEICANNLYKEFSQGCAVIHCNDEIAADFSTLAMQKWLIEQRHPRTAIGITSYKEMIIVVVDGRQEISEGLSLPELALFMKQLGCIQALNLGGGGCTTLCIDQQVVNNPSAREERPVSEALCFYLANY